MEDGYEMCLPWLNFNCQLEGLARFAALLLAPAEGFSLRAGLFFALGTKKQTYYAALAHFWQFLVPSINLGNFQ